MELFPEDEVERVLDFVISRCVETLPVKTSDLELLSEMVSEAGIEM